MSRKSNLREFKNIVNGDMSASITSKNTDIEFLDNIGIQLDFSGSPVGTFQAQVSNNHVENTNGHVENAGTWVAVTVQYFDGTNMVTARSIPSSVGTPIYIDLNQLSAKYIRIVYTAASGSGTLNGSLTAKMI